MVPTTPLEWCPRGASYPCPTWCIIRFPPPLPWSFGTMMGGSYPYSTPPFHLLMAENWSMVQFQVQAILLVCDFFKEKKGKDKLCIVICGCSSLGIHILAYLHLVSRDIFLVFISCIHIFRIHSHTFKAHFDKRNHVVLVQITYVTEADLWSVKTSYSCTKTKKNISQTILWEKCQTSS